LEQIADIYTQTAQSISSLIQYKEVDSDNQIKMRHTYGQTAIELINGFNKDEVNDLKFVAWELSKIGDGSKQIAEDVSPAEYVRNLFKEGHSLQKHGGKLGRFTLLLNAQIAQQQEDGPKTEGRQIPFPLSKKQTRTLQA
jgi:hypothetical protein